jgi:hypothetical protein
VTRLAADTNFSEDLGEHLIELLDRVDGRRKPAMVGCAPQLLHSTDIQATSNLGASHGMIERC